MGNSELREAFIDHTNNIAEELSKIGNALFDNKAPNAAGLYADFLNLQQEIKQGLREFRKNLD